MFKNGVGGFKRAAALLMSILMLMGQFALPMGALAQHDLSLLPSLRLYYMVGEEPRDETVSYSLYGEDMPVYWATLDSDAMGIDMTLEILPSGDERVTYNSSHGYQFFSSDAAAVDEFFITSIQVYVEETLVGEYPLYLSTLPLPEPEEEEDEPVYFNPVTVTVAYFDQEGNKVHEYTRDVDMEGYTFDPYRELPEGYNLITTDAVTVWMDETGALNQTYIEFWMEKVQVSHDPVTVTVVYFDQQGNKVHEYTRDVDMEGYTFDPYRELPDGYNLITTDAVTVWMDENGALSQTYIEFWMEKIQVSHDPVTVTVVYFDQEGNKVHEYTRDVDMEGYTFDPYRELPEGYNLITTDAVTVWMDENGALSQTYIEFWMEKVQVSHDPVTVTVVYFDQEGNKVHEYTRDVDMEGYTFDPYRELPEGYNLITTDAVTVWMDETGALSQTYIEFWMEKTQQEPQEPDEPEDPIVPDQKPADVYVHYMADQVIYEEMYTLDPGSHSIAPNQALVESLGYVLETKDAAAVEVYNDGTASVNPVVFSVSLMETPEAPEQPQQPETPETPETPEEPEEDEDEQEGSTAPDGVTVLEELDCQGETTGKGLNVRPGPGKEYKQDVFQISKTGTVVDVHRLVQNASGEKWYYITYEGRSGYVSADFLNLIAKEPAQAEVTFYYVDEQGDALMDARKETLTENTYTSAEFRYEAPDGYTYSHASSETIVVDENGANPSEVAFTYVKDQPKEITADVTFYYLDDQNQTLMHERTETLKADTYNSADFRYEAPEGYTYSHASSETIVVDENGASPSSVTFVYAKETPKEIKADIAVRYVAEDGSAIPGYDVFTDTYGEGTHDVSKYQVEIAGYEFVSMSHTQVSVTENGASPAEIIITYRKKPVQAEVIFHYQDENGGKLIESRIETLGEAEYESSRFAPEIQGHSYLRASVERFTVDANGASVSEITLIYASIPVEAQVLLSFVDQNGQEVPGLGAYSKTLGEGTHDTSLLAASAPAGYVYSHPSDAQIRVTAEGATPSAVTFFYTKLPTEITLPVRYLDADRNPLLPETVLSFTSADFGKMLESKNYLPEYIEGYNYASVNSDVITIDATGNITPQALEFTYVVRPKAEASVTFEYISDGRAVASPLTVKLPEGETDTMEYAAYPDGYNFVSASAQTVTVTPDGKAEPSVVTFTYEKKSTTAELKVHYRTSIGTELEGSPEIRKLEVGTHTITPNPAFAPSGYNLSGNTQSYQVTVGEELVAYPNSVTFTYYDASIKGSVTVNYYNSQTNELIATEMRELAPGTYQLTPNQSLVDSKGKYEISDVLTNTAVEVKENGQAIPTVVNFYYKPADIDVYQGYLLVTRQTALRAEPSTSGNAVMALPVDTVLWTAGQYQSGSIMWNSSQTATGSSASGWVNDADVRRISADEAYARIEEYEQENSKPEQQEGYYITIMDSVPLRRYMDTAAQAKYLKNNTVVYVSSQAYDSNGYLWHETTYDNVTGYVRDGQLRKLTADEVNEYLSAGNPINPGEGGSQYDPNGASSYGYVTKDSVNFRSGPNGTRLKMLNKYGMALIIGTREVNGVTWYNVNYSGQTGWIHGDYFHQMTLTEFTSFMGSKEYYQGITNNTVTAVTTPKPGSTSTGSATQGNVSSVEDWNVGIWQNTGVNTQASYQPFNPYATPVATLNPKGDYQIETAGTKLYDMANTSANATALPKDAQVTVTGTVTMNGKTWYAVTYQGKTGYIESGVSLKQAAATASPEPTSTFVIGTMIPINYEDESKETQTSTVPWGLIGGAIVLVGGAGGVYAYALNQNKRRKAAAARAAAQRRAQAAAGGTAAAGATSPYARRAVAAPPTGNAQQRSQMQPTRPMNPPYGNPQGSYGSTQTNVNPYSRPYSGSTQDTQPSYAPSSYAQPEEKPVSYAPAQENMNPYARPQTQANPYAAPTAPPSSQTPAGSNPYARPISTPSAQPRSAAEDTATAAPRRRATRMQRYHDAGSDGE